MYTVTNTQVAVKYRRNVSSLLIDMSVDNRTTTLGRHIDRHIGRVSVNISTNAWPICRPIYRATHLGRHIVRHSSDMSTDISVDTRVIFWPIRWSTVGRYVDRYVGRGVHKIHMIQVICLFSFISWPNKAIGSRGTGGQLPPPLKYFGKKNFLWSIEQKTWNLLKFAEISLLFWNFS